MGVQAGIARRGARAAAVLLAGGLLTLAGQGAAQADGTTPVPQPAPVVQPVTPCTLLDAVAGRLPDPLGSVLAPLCKETNDWG
ncbi:hypothetical protein ABZZ17_36575 [Streptomyces sp. NPDC006512]|uniref:hypothetical protein n=1 Tax=Streptomyces sp. NPDC006512 TaxID=3154307 RepID=UPI0033ADD83D